MAPCGELHEGDLFVLFGLEAFSWNRKWIPACYTVCPDPQPLITSNLYIENTYLCPKNKPHTINGASRLSLEFQCPAPTAPKTFFKQLFNFPRVPNCSLSAFSKSLFAYSIHPLMNYPAASSEYQTESCFPCAASAGQLTPKGFERFPIYPLIGALYRISASHLRLSNAFANPEIASPSDAFIGLNSILGCRPCPIYPGLCGPFSLLQYYHFSLFSFNFKFISINDRLLFLGRDGRVYLL